MQVLIQDTCHLKALLLMKSSTTCRFVWMSRSLRYHSAALSPTYLWFKPLPATSPTKNLFSSVIVSWQKFCILKIHWSDSCFLHKLHLKQSSAHLCETNRNDESHLQEEKYHHQFHQLSFMVTLKRAYSSSTSSLIFSFQWEPWRIVHNLTCFVSHFQPDLDGSYRNWSAIK